MRKRDFRNGVTWSYTGYEADSSCYFLYSHNIKRDEGTIGASKIRLNHFPAWSVSIDPASTAKRKHLNPPRKSKTTLQYKHVFSTNDWLLHTYYEIAGAWFEIKEFSQFLIISVFWQWKMATKQKWPNFRKKTKFWNYLC